MLPYGRQTISEDDIQEVVKALRSDFITTGPKVDKFEKAVAHFSDAKYAVAVSSGTAALHCAMAAIGIKSGDEVIVPTLTFVASANCVAYCGGTPVFADSRSADLLIDPVDVELKITKKTKAVIAVDYAGQPCDYDTLRNICDKYGLFLISDASHSIGSEYKGRKTGSIADITCFSFHPVKHITTGEGGMSVTDNPDFAEKMKLFRNHGITTDYRQREEKGSHYYEMTELGFNYRITDFQCALGISQLKKLPNWIKRRQEIAAKYDEAFEKIAEITPLLSSKYVSNAYHLYVIRLSEKLDRDKVFAELRKKAIGVNVHYIPVHMHPYYRNMRLELQDSSTSELPARSKAGAGKQNSRTIELPYCPVAEEVYKHIISIPMFPAMNDHNIRTVVEKVELCLN